MGLMFVTPSPGDFLEKVQATCAPNMGQKRSRFTDSKERSTSPFLVSKPRNSPINGSNGGFPSENMARDRLEFSPTCARALPKDHFRDAYYYDFPVFAR